jgi:DNA polymerase delta subunit 1
MSGETVVMPTFESNLPFFLRFMIDSDVVGMSWIEVSNHVLRTES